MNRNSYDLIVVGAGHAGIEAAAAAARLGARVALISSNWDTVGKMSCNPAIGGVAKGQLVREIDALGGLMARAADACGIHWRLLGRGKGPAMWSPRAQCDRSAYSQWMKQFIESTPLIFPIQGECVDLLSDSQRRVTGVQLRDQRCIQAPCSILSTGTFLQGLLHQGTSQIAGGRMGEEASHGLSAALSRLGLRLRRMKTGTPMRLHADSIAWEHCLEQAGDPDPRPFSFLPTTQAPRNQCLCWIAHTNPQAHAQILENLERAPLYNGQIDSVGPRYCPSIEDKVVRFANRDRHQLFLEPEGIHTREIYVNGLSTSLPIDIQDQVLTAIPALAQAHVIRYGYAVEYDMVDPQHLDERLALRDCPGLFLAGQINGTSGYEEAAMQGLLAGTNAILSLNQREPLVLSRADAYAGVMVHDLIAGGLDEPYRLFTSRAEHRLRLRADNADRRLTALAARCGLVDADRAAQVAAKEAAIQALMAAIDPSQARRIAGEGLSQEAAQELVPLLAEASPEIAEGAWIELRYASYLQREQQRVERLQQMRDVALPEDLNWDLIPGLSNEGRGRLQRGRPLSLGAAAEIPGVVPADIETLWAWMLAQGKKRRRGTESHGRPAAQ